MALYDRKIMDAKDALEVQRWKNIQAVNEQYIKDVTALQEESCSISYAPAATRLSRTSTTVRGPTAVYAPASSTPRPGDSGLS